MLFTSLVSIHREDKSNTTTILENMRSGVGFYVGFDNEDIFLGKRKRPIQLNSKFSLKKQLITFLKDKNIDIDYAQTQFNTVLDNEGPCYCASFFVPSVPPCQGVTMAHGTHLAEADKK